MYYVGIIIIISGLVFIVFVVTEVLLSCGVGNKIYIKYLSDTACNKCVHYDGECCTRMGNDTRIGIYYQRLDDNYNFLCGKRGKYFISKNIKPLKPIAKKELPKPTINLEQKFLDI